MVDCSLQRLIAGGYARQIMYVDQFYVLLTPRLIKLPSLLWVNLEPSNSISLNPSTFGVEALASP